MRAEVESRPGRSFQLPSIAELASGRAPIGILDKPLFLIRCSSWSERFARCDPSLSARGRGGRRHLIEVPPFACCLGGLPCRAVAAASVVLCRPCLVCLLPGVAIHCPAERESLPDAAGRRRPSTTAPSSKGLHGPPALTERDIASPASALQQLLHSRPDWGLQPGPPRPGRARGTS